jgi:type I restriction enzyme M protein
LQFLLAKLYDEHTHSKPQQEMTIQDFGDSLLGDPDVKKAFDGILQKAVNYYGKYLPKPVAPNFSIVGSMLRDVSTLLAPVRILGSRRDVIQDFYMYFAQGVYRWDLAQYFTPSEVVDFIVALTNPRAGDQVKDPACGSADFLISSLHYANSKDEDLRDSIWGADNSENAVQISVLNMLLNGDGKSNIKNEDSLVNVNNDTGQYSVILCNPPFGVKIKERSFDVLKNFDLGHDWSYFMGYLDKQDTVMDSQEVGILFAELCVRQAQPGGRIGIILPNGYLGNRSMRYLAMREWLLRHTRLVAVIGFPRFTFKKSGADVSASVVLLEKRDKPLARASDSDTYPFYAGILESVGWSVSNKKSERIFKRHPETGVYLTDQDNEPIIDADFGNVLNDLYNSSTVNAFPWVIENVNVSPRPSSGWSMNVKEVLTHPVLNFDPKRWCNRAVTTRQQITAMPHFAL